MGLRAGGCQFILNKKGKATKIIINEQRTLSSAWHKAITMWGNLNGIREKDIQLKLNNPPSPDVFKALRAYLNEHEGRDIAPSVLRHVYAEQRLDLAQRNVKLPAEVKADKEELLGFHSSLERELSNFLSRSASTS